MVQFRWALILFMVATCAAEQKRGPISPSLPLQYGPLVLGEPVSAIRVLDFEPSKANENGEAMHGEQVFVRDSKGRTRSETYYGSGEVAITILDPVAQTELRWVSGQKYAVLATMRPWAMAEPQRSMGRLRRVLEGVETNGVIVQPSERNRWVSESWFSPDLHLAMLTVTDDPEIGKTTYSFQDVVREEPDPKLFKAPHGVKVIDSRAKASSPMIEIQLGWPRLPGQVSVGVPLGHRPVASRPSP